MGSVMHEKPPEDNVTLENTLRLEGSVIRETVNANYHLINYMVEG